MNPELLQAIKEGNLSYIQNYCNNGKDSERFREVMTLGIPESGMKPNEKGLSALLVAAKNSHVTLVSFIIMNAMQESQFLKLLAEQLIQKTPEGKNVLHEAAVVPNNEHVIGLICQAAADLHKQGLIVSKDLTSYVDLADDNFCSRPLHFAVRQGNFSNYLALVKAKADTKAKASNGMIPIELIKFCDPSKSEPFMHDWVLKIDEGYSYFKQRHGILPTDLSEKALAAIIKIDLDSMLVENPRAQFHAYEEAIRLLPFANNEKEWGVLLSAMGHINYSIITTKDMGSNDTGTAQLLIAAIDKANTIDDKNTELRNIYIKAEILRQMKGFPVANKEAFAYYARLVTEYPELALAGMKKLDQKDLNQDVLAKRLVVAICNIKLNYLKDHSTKHGFMSFLSKDKDKFTIDGITKFLAALREVASTEEIVDLIVKLPARNEFEALKKDCLAELNSYNLISESKLKP